MSDAILSPFQERQVRQLHQSLTRASQNLNSTNSRMLTALRTSNRASAAAMLRVHRGCVEEALAVALQLVAFVDERRLASLTTPGQLWDADVSIG